MEINQNKKTKQILIIVVCIIIAVVSTVFNHTQLGKGKSIKEIFYGEETETSYSDGM